MSNPHKVTPQMAIAATWTVLAILVGCTPRLDPEKCNSLVSAWNRFAKQYAAYNDQLKSLKATISSFATPPPPKPGFLMEALVDPSTVSAIVSKPTFDLSEFSSAPDVQLAIQDVAEDIDSLIVKFTATKITQNGSWATEQSKGGFTMDALLLGYGHGTSGPEAFRKSFGPVVAKFHADYDRASKKMSAAYQSECGGDPTEIRDQSEFSTVEDSK